jgi:hypothetical protein
MSDAQDRAEQFDQDVIGGADPVEPDAAILSEEAVIDFPPDRPLGIDHADADVTDESLEQRVAQEQPDVWETELDEISEVDSQEP